jgi:peptidoglycan/xylan/chitin deacetylase (PgdA/CDA1 family)
MPQHPDSMLPPDLIILMYHHVTEPPPDAPVRGLYVTPQQFAWQMDWLLKHKLKFCTFDALAMEESQGPGPWVMVTFDDGYRDVYEQAWPLLVERQIPAVVYPVVGDLGKRGVVWPESYDSSPAAVLAASEVQEMARGTIEFGSHLLDHIHADRLELPELRRQLTSSHQILSGLLGRPPLSIAYPYGAYSPEIAQEAAQAGYRFGVTTRAGSNRRAPLMELRRIAVKGTRWYHRWEFARTLTRALAAAKTDG